MLMRKFSIFLFLSLLLLQSCQPAAKAASFPLTASHIKAATETVSSQILEKDSETQLYHAIREWGKQISLLDICTGDIGNDGAADAAIIVEYPCTGEFGSYRKRTIFVILDTSSYTPDTSSLYQNSTLIGGSNSGGMGQDPYQSMEISDGKLIIQENYRAGGTKNCFSLINGELVWDSYWIFSIDRGGGDYDRRCYDFLNGTLQYQAGHDWDQDEELQTFSFTPVTVPFSCENITNVTSHINQKLHSQ